MSRLGTSETRQVRPPSRFARAVMACSLLATGVVGSGAPLATAAGQPPAAATVPSTQAAAAGGMVSSLGVASLTVPRATGYEAVDPAEGYGTIAGTVVVPEEIHVDYLTIAVEDSAGTTVDTADIDADGTFGVTSLDAGTYNLVAVGWTTSGNSLTGGPIEVSVELGMLASGAVIQVSEGADPRLGAIAGTVTGPSGDALPSGTSGSVEVYDSSGNGVNSDDFEEDGAFLVGGLDEGSYRVLVSAGGFATEWWQDAGTLASAAPIVVSKGSTSTINPELNVGGSISGSLTGPGGVPLSGEVTAVNSAGADVKSDYSSSDGSYQIDALASGPYTVRFAPFDSVHEAEWWDDAATSDDATPIEVTEGVTRGGIDAELALRATQPSSISGTITTSDGSPLAAGTSGAVEVYDSNGEWAGWTEFFDDGAFRVANLEPGDYTLAIDPYGTEYAKEWWEDASARSSAATITVASSGSTIVNPRLDLAGSISGIVRGPGGAPLDAGTFGWISAHDADGQEVDQAEIDDSGAFQLAGLAGDYAVQIYIYEGNYFSEWWQDSTSQPSEPNVTVTAGGTTLINPVLNRSGSISGTVTGPDGAALQASAEGIVTAYDGTGAPAGQTSFQSDGAYELTGLGTGSYVLRVSSLDYHYRTQWWDHELTGPTATPVQVTEGKATVGVNPHLDSTSVPAGGVGGSLRGLVPARLADTRPGYPTVDGVAAGGGAVAAGGVVKVPVAGRGGVAADAGAVALNVTATGPDRSGYVTVWPTGTTRPNASNLNFVKGQTVPNLVLVPVGSDGTVSLYSTATTHLIVDVTGWFPPPSS